MNYPPRLLIMASPEWSKEQLRDILSATEGFSELAKECALQLRFSPAEEESSKWQRAQFYQELVEAVSWRFSVSDDALIAEQIGASELHLKEFTALSVKKEQRYAELFSLSQAWHPEAIAGDNGELSEPLELREKNLARPRRDYRIISPTIASRKGRQALGMVGALGLCRQYPAEKLLLLGGLEAQHWPEVIGGGGFGIALQSGADHPEKLSAHLRELAKFPRLPSL